MRKTSLCCGLIVLLLASGAMAATEETKQTAIDNGLAWLAATQVISGSEGYWVYAGGADGNLAATASAALAFIEEGYLPGDASMYDAVITRAVNYIFNRATLDARFGVETAVYTRYAEDYNNDGPPYDGNNQAIYFEPGLAQRRVYTTGICAPVVYALGNAYGTGTVVGIGSAAISGKTYAQAMQDIVDWFAFAQIEPNRGNYRGGWRYDANWVDADNSTAQWGALPLLYAADWGLSVSQYVFNELTLWVNYIQNPSGGSGYGDPWTYVNVAKTGGLLLELAAIGAPVGDTRVVKALNFINGRWNTGPASTWYGNLDHPYAMWAVYKGLQVYGFLNSYDCGPGTIMVGSGMPAAPGGFPICFDASPQASSVGDWYSHYCEYLCGIQAGDGSWGGYSYWTGALCVGWYINILNAVEVPEARIRVSLDIKPQSCPNPLNVKIFENMPEGAMTKKGGVLPVAILGTADLDVYEIDVSSLLLAGVAPIRHNYDDVATPYVNGEECGCTSAGPDGDTDLTLKFQKSQIAEALGTVYDGDVIPLEITGVMLDGTPLDGTDCVLIRSMEVETPMILGGEVSLDGAVPNPFNPVTRIRYHLPEQDFVDLSVYDVRGRLIGQLVAQVEAAGDHVFEWNASGLASGIYFYRLRVGDFDETRKMILVK